VSGSGGFVAALLAGWVTALAAALVTLLVAAALAAPRDMSRADLLRVYPNLLRLLISLSKDKRVARPVRWRLLLALAYDAQPINLIPDFIPVVGMADNLAITAWAVRSAIRRSGRQVVLSHWRGGAASFSLLCKLCRLDAKPDSLGPDEPGPPHQGQQAGHSLGDLARLS
jgi:uncharacterized membrane protein YkvA (DUF1232 family)